MTADPAGPVAVDALVDGSVDGVVLTASTLDSELPAVLARHRLPVVLLNRETDAAEFDACVPDNAGGAAAVARLLLGLGHRRFGVLTGPS